MAILIKERNSKSSKEGEAGVFGGRKGEGYALVRVL